MYTELHDISLNATLPLCSGTPAAGPQIDQRLPLQAWQRKYGA